MTTEIIIAGFGGQGVLSMGKILAHAAADSGKEVSWLPSYGPEQRGGTSNVTVIVSDERISSPVVGLYDVAIILNQQSLDKFESRVKKGGILIYDKYGISDFPTRTDIRIYGIDAMQTAVKSGIQKTFNMLVLGALLRLVPLVTSEAVIESLAASLPPRYHHLLDANRKAIDLGRTLPDATEQHTAA